MKGIEIIKDMRPCDGSIPYMESKEDFYQAWNDCERGDWMLWIAVKLKVEFKLMVKANAMCALTVKHLMTDQLSINYCETALLFSDGKATIQDLKEASISASSILYKTRLIASIIPSYDTYSAAHAAASAIEDSAIYSAHAVSDPNNKNARKRNRIETANICREILTEEVFKLWDKKLKP